jgi:hypothetical protein
MCFLRCTALTFFIIPSYALQNIVKIEKEQIYTKTQSTVAALGVPAKWSDVCQRQVGKNEEHDETMEWDRRTQEPGEIS